MAQDGLPATRWVGPAAAGVKPGNRMLEWRGRQHVARVCRGWEAGARSVSPGGCQNPTTNPGFACRGRRTRSVARDAPNPSRSPTRARYAKAVGRRCRILVKLQFRSVMQL